MKPAPGRVMPGKDRAMIFFSNTTTARLEGYARARGRDLGIIQMPQNNGGRYHVASEDGNARSHWYPLGWTVREAREALDQMTARVAEDA